MVVTGGAKGIGRELVKIYLSRGAKVAAMDVSEVALVELAREVASPNLVTLSCDVSDPLSLAAAADRAIERQGKPELWVNNAGVSELGSFTELSAEKFDRVWRVNFLGVVNGCRIALSRMREPERGMLVNVASMNGIVPAPFMSAYTASKHAVVGFTRSLHLEFRQQNAPYRVLLVCPGFVQTDIMNARDGFEFPKWLQPAIGDPALVAQEIFQAVADGKEEIFPTFNGKMMKAAHRLAPTWLARSSRILTAQSWKELLGLKGVRARREDR